MYVLFLVLRYFTFIFVGSFIWFYFLFVAGGEGVQCVHLPLTSLHLLDLTYSTGRGALLCFNLLLYSVVIVWRRGASVHLRARPSLHLQRRETACRRTATPLASREPHYCLTRAVLANHCLCGGDD